MKLFFPLFFFAICLLNVACNKKKNVDCDATLCVINRSPDTIRYCWGCNSYNEILPPGQSACTAVGHIKIRNTIFSSTESTVDAFFQTSQVTYQIPVDECNEERIIE
jgi:hypothetical protein